MIEPLIYFGISLLFAGLIVWAVMPLVHRRAARLFEARQQVESRSQHLNNDLAPLRDQDEIVELLKDKVAGQNAELDNNVKTITQLNIDRDLLKVELDALRIQHADMGQLRDAINRLESECDTLRNEVDTLRAQRVEWTKSTAAIKRLEIERDNLKNQIDTLKSQIGTQRKRPTRPAPTGASANQPGPSFLPLDATQRAQFPSAELNEEGSQRDETADVPQVRSN